MKFLKSTITVDPGWNSGWANWEGTLHPQTGLIVAPEMEDECERIMFMYEKIKKVFSKYKPRTVYVEGTQFWAGSLKSEMSWKTEDNIYLSYLIGSYIIAARTLGIDAAIITAVQWKGQATDDQIRMRVARRNAMEYVDFYGANWPHVTDAVAMGMSIMGILNKGGERE